MAATSATDRIASHDDHTNRIIYHSSTDTVSSSHQQHEQQTPSGIIYRPMTWSDVDDIVTQFEATWGRFSSAAGTPASIVLSRHFVLHYLEPATHTILAERDGQFLGVIVCRVVGCPRLFPQATPALADVDCMLQDDPRGAQALTETLRWHALEIDLEHEVQANETTQGEIELFLVARAARGHGVGGTLWRSAMRTMREVGVTRYFLHTDSTCDVSFYVHQGLSCLISWYAAGHPEYGKTMADVYIYAGATDAASSRITKSQQSQHSTTHDIHHDGASA